MSRPLQKRISAPIPIPNAATRIIRTPPLPLPHHSPNNAHRPIYPRLPQFQQPPPRLYKLYTT
ncbi:MAG: hypothetical protein LBQ31_10340 [Bacteroidales bacterium]|nr:hypothetical protein [Bacteroidales bacterium]